MNSMGSLDYLHRGLVSEEGKTIYTTDGELLIRLSTGRQCRGGDAGILNYLESSGTEKMQIDSTYAAERL